MRSQKFVFAVGIWFALLTIYIYSHESSDTFAIYLIAMALWIGLFAYCVRNRQKAPHQVGGPPALGQPPRGRTSPL